jgi:hypothetical protein
VEHVHSVLKLGDIDHPKRTRLVPNTNLCNGTAHARHGLEVVWQQAILETINLVSRLTRMSEVGNDLRSSRELPRNSTDFIALIYKFQYYLKFG